MKTKTDRLVDQVESVEDVELVELGDVSEDTKGGIIGFLSDSGFGLRKL